MVMHLKSQEDNIVGHVVSYTCPILVSYLYKIDVCIMNNYVCIFGNIKVCHVGETVGETDGE